MSETLGKMASQVRLVVLVLRVARGRWVQWVLLVIEAAKEERVGLELPGVWVIKGREALTDHLVREGKQDQRVIMVRKEL